jgi:hypothetical protein
MGQPTFNAVFEALPELNMNGFRVIRIGRFGTTDAKHEEYRGELLNHTSWAKTIAGQPSEDRLRQLQKWLGSFEIARTWTRSTSYSLKHLFESESGVYLPNGIFIVGVLMAGFSAKVWNNSPNAVFQFRRPVVR